MNFWTITKYVFFVLFFVIMVGAFTLHYDSEETQQTPQVTANQSKFNL